MNITIVGGGISGLSLAYFLLEKQKNLEITVLEASKRPGGKIWTDRNDGFLCESGVNGFLDNKPRTLEFVKSLSLKPLRSNDAARRRYIYHRGRLHLLPESPGAFLLSGLISPCGKGRLLYEILAPRATVEDESLASFARRRLGKEAYEMFIDPMASGIYAGDPEKLSLKSCFPRIYELERNYGSLFRALIKLQKEAKKTGREVGPSPGGTLTSFFDGMETVIKTLREYLGERIRTSSKVVGLDQVNSAYRLYLENGETVKSDAVVLACPAYETAEILKEMNRDLPGILNRIPYPPVSVVCLGFRIEDISHNINGFGFLVPYKEGRRILGTLWDSSIFPNRAPDGYVLFRTMVGGARAPEIALNDEETLVNIVLEELSEIMGLDATPELKRVYRHEKAIPQYNVGHAKLLEEIETRVGSFKGLYLTGNAYRGIGFNDCIENSFKLSERIFAEMIGNN